MNQRHDDRKLPLQRGSQPPVIIFITDALFIYQPCLLSRGSLSPSLSLYALFNSLLPVSGLINEEAGLKNTFHSVVEVRLSSGLFAPSQRVQTGGSHDTGMTSQRAYWRVIGTLFPVLRPGARE